MPALMAVIGGSADPLRRELQQVEAMARRAGANIERGLSGGGHMGTSGIVREFLVLTREVSAGNWTKVPGSLSILLQRMGILKFIIKDNATAAKVLAEAWAEQADKASIAAVASTRKAAASAAALYAEGGETEANLAVAASDEARAVADVAAAKAAQAKAAASMEAAAAAEAEAGATGMAVGALGIATGVLVALGAGAYAAWKLTKYLSDELSGLKPPDFHPEYIAKHLQSRFQAYEIEKDINKEIAHQAELYDSAVKSAERASKATKDRFEHEKKMLEYRQRIEMAGAKTEDEKRAVREKYSVADVQLKANELNAQLADKITAQANLAEESNRKKRAADAIQVNSKEHDEQLLKKARMEAEEARKYLAELEKSGGHPVFRGYNAVAATGISGSDLDAVQRANRAEANRRIMAERTAIENSATNEERRKQKEDLSKAAKEAAGKAVTAGLEVSDMKRDNAFALSRYMDEQAAKLDAENAGGTKAKLVRGHLTELQQIGAYVSPGTVTLVDVAKKSEHHLKEIKNHLQKNGAFAGTRNLGKVHY